jgi:hypothetical protein
MTTVSTAVWWCFDPVQIRTAGSKFIALVAAAYRNIERLKPKRLKTAENALSAARL